MAVIAVIQQKGGVGKSTITANLAAELVEKNLIVRVLDLDPQESLATWARLGGGVLSEIVGPVSGDSAPIRTGFRGESEQESGLKANTIPVGSRTSIPI